QVCVRMVGESSPKGDIMKARLLLTVLLALGCVLPVSARQDKDKHPDNERGDEPNPRLVVPNVDEPDVALDGKTSERADFVAPIQGGGFIFERRDTDGKRIGGVVVPGVIMVNRGLVELFGCGEGGKEHETISGSKPTSRDSTSPSPRPDSGGESSRPRRTST